MHRPTHARCATQLTNHIVRGDFTAYFKLLMKLPYTLAAAASVYLPNMRLAMVRQLAVASAIVYDPAGGPLAPLPASVTGPQAERQAEELWAQGRLQAVPVRWLQELLGYDELGHAHIALGQAGLGRRKRMEDDDGRMVGGAAGAGAGGWFGHEM